MANANVNKVILIGRLTRDPECRDFQNGGKVAQFGFAVNNNRKNQQTGEWISDPAFIDVKAFNRGDKGKMADIADQYYRKGDLAFVEGHLVMETWNDKNDGGKRTKLVIVADRLLHLGEPKASGGDDEQDGAAAPQQRPRTQQRTQAPPQQRPARPRSQPPADQQTPAAGGAAYDGGDAGDGYPPDDSEIPF